jgi:hypothetical protein
MRRKLAVGVAVAFFLSLWPLLGPPAAGAQALRDFQLSISGWTRLNVLVMDTLAITGAGSPFVVPARIPFTEGPAVDPELVNTQTILDARRARLRIGTSGLAGQTRISSLIEGDFSTGDGNARVSNSRTLRLRHAYARGDMANGFFLLAGQTWGVISEYQYGVGVHRTLDEFGAPGQIFTRQPQVRAGWQGRLLGGTFIIDGVVEKQSLGLQAGGGLVRSADAVQGPGGS